MTLWFNWMDGGFHSSKQETPEEGHTGRGEIMKSVLGLGYLWDIQAELSMGVWIYRICKSGVYR